MVKSHGKARIGVVGVGRGMNFAELAKYSNMELVSICDTWEEKLNEAGERLNVTTYTDYDKFLETDMDGVILANYFHEHAPFAIKALESGKHVLSETSACKTLKEGVALARAVEKSGKIYMFAENYAYFSYVQEMKRLYELGEVGEMMYGEGEYIHPMDSHSLLLISPGKNHWRNNLPSTYYSTHALSPLIYITGTRPVNVNAQCIPYFEQDRDNLHARRCDPASVIICRMNNGAMIRLAGNGLRGHGNWYRIHGTRGLMENLRSGNREAIRIVHEEWDRREGDVSEKIYTPDFPVHADLAKTAGHGGGDFFIDFYFSEAIRKNEQPFLDVYRALDMTLVGIQGYKSALSNGAPFEIPDFRNESERKKYENDDWSPWPKDRKPGQPWPSIKGEVIPSKEAVDYARKVWKEIGYEGE